MPETVQHCSDYEHAGKAACKWVEDGRVKVDHANLRVYYSRVGPYKDRAVGVGLLRGSGIVEYIIRIDCDDTGKGIHFNAKNLTDTTDKLAAVLRRTVEKTPHERTTLFEDYLNALDNLEAYTIWEWWRTGRKPGWPW